MTIAPQPPSLSYRFCRQCFRAFFAFYFRFRIRHPERVPRKGPVILAPNHVSYADPVFVTVAVQRLVIGLARKSAFRVPVGGSILRSWHAIPVDRDGASGEGLRTILQRLREGNAVQLFPEGTRSMDGKLQPPQPGIGLLIAKSDAPVVPIHISGAYEAWGRRLKVPRPRHVELTFGKPIDFAKLRARARKEKGREAKAIYQQAAEKLMTAINTLNSHQAATLSGSGKYVAQENANHS